MPEKMPQTYADHTRLDPAYHFFVLPVAAMTIGIAIYNLIRAIIAGVFDFMTIWFLVLALAFAVVVLKSRLYALKAQDRVIRLEERLRLSILLSEPLRSRIGELTEGQLIALRFASDDEVAELAEKALSDKMPCAEIKKSIKTWRPDYFRV
jgi:hypothetical protein